MQFKIKGIKSGIPRKPPNMGLAMPAVPKVKSPGPKIGQATSPMRPKAPAMSPYLKSSNLSTLTRVLLGRVR